MFLPGQSSAGTKCHKMVTRTDANEKKNNLLLKTWALDEPTVCELFFVPRGKNRHESLDISDNIFIGLFAESQNRKREPGAQESIPLPLRRVVDFPNGLTTFFLWFLKVSGYIHLILDRSF